MQKYYVKNKDKEKKDWRQPFDSSTILNRIVETKLKDKKLGDGQTDIIKLNKKAGIETVIIGCKLRNPLEHSASPKYRVGNFKL